MTEYGWTCPTCDEQELTRHDRRLEETKADSGYASEEEKEEETIGPDQRQGEPEVSSEDERNLRIFWYGVPEG